MPDLNLGPAPTRSPLPAILIAFAVLVAIAAAVFLLNPHKTAELAVTNVELYATHIETKGSSGGMNVIGAAPQIDNDLYVIIRVKITDELRLPLFIKDETAILTAPDGSITTASAIPVSQLANLCMTFPPLAALTVQPLARDTDIAPSQSAEGMVLLHFPTLTEADWKQRKSAILTFDLFHQSPQTITIP